MRRRGKWNVLRYWVEKKVLGSELDPGTRYIYVYDKVKGKLFRYDRATGWVSQVPPNTTKNPLVFPDSANNSVTIHTDGGGFPITITIRITIDGGV